MRLLLSLILLCGHLYSGDWAARMDSLIGLEWQAMPDSQRAVVWAAYDWGKERDFREMGAIYAVENRGRMRAVRREYNGDESAGPGQNLVRYAASRVYGDTYSRLQYDKTKDSLQVDLQFSLYNSYEHIRLGLRKFDTRWEVIKWYNGYGAPHEKYPARVFAWLRFLDNKRRK